MTSWFFESNCAHVLLKKPLFFQIGFSCLSKIRCDLLWMHAMLCVWSIFFVVLFIVEPLILRRRFEVWAARSPDGAFRLLHRAHVLLLGLSLVTVIGAVAGSRGFSPL